jgi:hypothetical protein
MSKKIKITEEQLKRLVVLKNQIQENDEPQMATHEPSKRDVDVDTEYEINESVQKIKSTFKRFL